LIDKKGAEMSYSAFVEARDFLLAHRTDYETAYRDFRWPQLTEFNWALDYFDVMAAGNDRPALWVVNEDGSEQKMSFADMSRRSNQVANWLRQQGVKRGDRILMMLGNEGTPVGHDAGVDQARRGVVAGHHPARS
jgi:acetyl-CoA synthetase